MKKDLKAYVGVDIGTSSIAAVALGLVIGVGLGLAPRCCVAEESFSVPLEVDVSAVRPGQVLFELPDRLRVSVREAGKDPALRDYDARFGNYLNFPMPDGTCPVLEAELPKEPRTVEYKDLSRRLPTGFRVGFPLSLLAASPKKHAVRVEFARTGLRIFADGRLMDEELLVAAPKWIAGAGLPPAPAPAAVPDATPIAGPVQYWTAGGFNTWVGDVVVRTWRGRLHVFFLRDRRHHHSKGGTGGHAFAHISSADLRTWVEHPDATTIDRYWLTYGTGTAFEMGGKLCLSYGFHSTRYVPVEKTTEPRMLKGLAETGVMPHVRFEGTDLIPLGTSWSESEDGVHFRPSGIVSHTTQNPGIENLPDGRLRLTTGYGGDTGAKGCWVSDGMTGWRADTAKPVLSGDCPCPFSWNGWSYLLQGFWGFARGKAGEALVPAQGSDVYDGLAVPMVAPWRDASGAESRRLLVGWIHAPGGLWAGWMVFRELVQRPDGSLGTKWVPEMPLPTPPVAKRCRGDFRLDFGTADGKRTYRFAVNAKKGEASVVEVRADGKTRPVSVLAATSQNTVTGIRGLDGEYDVRYVLHYDRKADATLLDAEIAGNRTLIVAIPRRLGVIMAARD